MKRVKCNHCESIFDEEHVRLKKFDDFGEEECCPVCGETGGLMDMEVGGGEPFKTPDEWEADTGQSLKNDAWVWKWDDRSKIWAMGTMWSVRYFPKLYADKELRVFNGPYPPGPLK